MYHDASINPPMPPINNPNYGCQEAIYKNENTTPNGANEQIVNEGDKRLTDVMVSMGSVITEYKAGTEVTEGDLDVNNVLMNFHKMEMFFDQDWPSKKIHKNGMFDIGEEIYRINPMQFVQEEFLTSPMSHGSRFCLGLDRNSGSEHLFDTVLYFDADNDQKASPGDIRVFDLSGRYENGSVLTVHDADCPTTLADWSNQDTLLYYSNYMNVFSLAEDYDINRPGAVKRDYKALYVDVDHSYDSLAPQPEKTWLTPGDIRLTWSYTYPQFSVVKAEDFDYDHYVLPENPLGMGACETNVWLWDRIDHNVLISDPDMDDAYLNNATWGIGEPLSPMLLLC